MESARGHRAIYSSRLDAKTGTLRSTLLDDVDGWWATLTIETHEPLIAILAQSLIATVDGNREIIAPMRLDTFSKGHRLSDEARDVAKGFQRIDQVAPLAPLIPPVDGAIP